MRLVKATSEGVYGEGGMKRSPLLTAVPPGVVTEMRPDPVDDGTLVPNELAVAVVTVPSVMLKRALLFAYAGSKFVPLIVSGVPIVAIPGLKPLIVGAPPAPPTMNDALLVADPLGAVTAIGPEVAPEGTAVTISVAVLDVSAAVTPLKLTVFCDAVALNPVP